MEINNNNIVDSKIQRTGRNTLGLPKDNINQTESINLGEGLKNFQGSYMVKINEHSSGTDKRYFYYNYDDLFKDKLKIYYTNKPSKISKSDDSCN